MSIIFSEYNGYQNLNTEVGTSTTSSQQMSVQNVNSTEAGTLSEGKEGQLVSGQVFSGEVVNVDGKDIQLMLNNHQLLNARLESGLNVAIGQILSFEVKSTANNQTSLRPLYANLTQNPSILNALKGANMQATATNIEMVSAMMDEGMPVNRNALWAMVKTINDYPQAKPSTLVQMMKLGMPIDDLTINQFDNYKNIEHQIIHDAENLAEGLAKLPAEIIQNGNDMQGFRLLGQIFSMLSIGKESSFGGKLAESVLLPEELSASKTEQQAPAETELNTDAAKQANITNAELKVLIEADMKGSPFNSVSQQHFFSDMLTQLGVSEENQVKLFTGSADTNEFLSFINTLVQTQQNGAVKLDDYQRNALEEMLGSKEFELVLKEAVLKQFVINPKEVAEEGKVEELYKRIVEQSAKIMDILQNAGKDTGAVMKSAQNMSDNVNFMNQLNQMMAYVQLPLRMNQENTHGELYVYTKKKNLADKDGNISALLHLEMEQLGTMDVYVAMQNSKVNTHFYLQDEKTLDFIEQHIELLDERLTKKGYQMSTSVTVKEEKEPQSIVKDFLKNESVSATPIVSKLSFDVRA